MQAVILVAGEGVRMRPLTYTTPKHLLKIANKTILQHNLEQLKESGIEDVILVAGYMQEKIKDYVNGLAGFNVTFVTQEKQLGTGHALLQVKNFVIEERFIVMYGDDLYDKDDIKAAVKNELCVTAKETEDPSRFGVFILENNNVKDLIEKPQTLVSNLANTGLYVLNMGIFKFLENVKKSQRNEFELTDAILAMSKETDIKCQIIERWIPIGYPWDILNANEIKIKDMSYEQPNEFTREENVSINGNVKIGKNTVIKSGAYIEGPVIIGNNCAIGPNCYIRPNCVIGNNCRIGNSVEIKNTIIGDNTNIEHLSYIGDSIIGNNCNLGAGSITANLRHDNKSIKTVVNGIRIDTRRRKFGVVMGNNVKTGVNVSMYPGIFIGPFSWTSPGYIVKNNLDPLTLDGEKVLDDEKFDIAFHEEIKFIRNKMGKNDARI